MGIVILMVLAFGIFSILRATFRFIKTRISTGKAITPVVAGDSSILRAASGFVRTRSSTSTSATSVSVQPAPSTELDWSAYETPTFIRRGISRPVLSEKKQKRVRKTKSANANLIEAVLSCFEERSLAIANMHSLEVKDDLKVELRALR
jgi:transglutaminase/protease-like cytokinesis protein 3